MLKHLYVVKKVCIFVAPIWDGVPDTKDKRRFRVVSVRKYSLIRFYSFYGVGSLLKAAC